MAEQKSRREIQEHLVARAMKDAAFRQELVSNPKGVLEREFGAKIPDAVNVSVLEESAQNVYLVLPPAPPGTGRELADKELEAVPEPPATADTYCFWKCTEDVGCLMSGL